MKLSALIASLPHAKVIGNPGVEVKGIAYDSRRVERGFVFVALKGRACDGHSFIGEAIGKGASVLLVERPQPGPQGIPQVVVSDTRKAMAVVSSIFYKEPSKRLTLLGVTGTNGKTTTTYLIESILQKAGHKVGVVGTINYRYPGHILPAPHTTPEAPDIQRILKEMADNRVTHCVMEVSSHAIVMKRLIGCEFTCGIFTNLSQDHLDFHKDMDDYFETKSYFFTHIVEGDSSLVDSFSVINVDDPKGKEIVRRLKNKAITYGILEGDVRPKDFTLSEEGIEGSLNTPKGILKFKSPLIGNFNLYNIMASVGAGIRLDLSLSDIEEGIRGLSNVAGRMERVYTSRGFDVIVDYAHTPDALERVLDTLASLKQGRVITVFGCGGDRDRAKRPLMGKVAATKSDIIILTSDNPRSEDPVKIIQDIRQGMNGSNRECYIEPDRRKAIKLALSLGEKGDTILIAGKGHEDYQEIKGVRYRFNDREILEEVAKNGGKVKGEKAIYGSII